MRACEISGGRKGAPRNGIVLGGDEELAHEIHEEAEAERLRRVECYAAYYRLHKQLPRRHVDALEEGASLLATGAVVLEPHPKVVRCTVCHDRKAIPNWSRQICKRCYNREHDERNVPDEHATDEHAGGSAAATTA